MNQNWYAPAKEEVERLLHTNAATGLSPKAARLRYRKKKQSCGGELLSVKKVPLSTLLLPLTTDVALWILLITLLVMTCFPETRGVWICLPLLLLHAALALLLGKSAALRREQIAFSASPKISVLRDGNVYRTDFRYVVEGDVVLLSEGDVVPFDLRLISSSGLSADVFVGNDEYHRPKYVRREKDDGADLSALSDLLPEEQTNMLTAGSIIQLGTARGIVVETGMNASTAIAYGGLRLDRDDPIVEDGALLSGARASLPLRPVGTLFLVATVPLTLLSYFLGAEKNFSLIFLTVLSLTSTFFTGSLLHLLDSAALERLLPKAKTKGRSETLTRSVTASEVLAKTDVVLIFGHESLTTGESRVSSLYCGGTVKRGREMQSADAGLLPQYLYMLLQKRDASLSAGSDEENSTHRALRHLITALRVDTEMLGIRYTVSEYRRINDPFTVEAIAFTKEDGKRGRFLISPDVRSLSGCKSVMLKDKPQPFSEQARFSVVRYAEEEASRGADILYCMEANDKGDLVFLGALSMAEAVLPDARAATAALAKENVLPLLFLRTYTRKHLHYARAAGFLSLRREIALAEQFRRDHRPIESDFGRYTVYVGFSDEEIASLVSFLAAEKKTVSALFSSPVPEAVRSKIAHSAVLSDLPEQNAKQNNEGDMPLQSFAEKGSVTEEMRLSADTLVQKHGKYNRKSGLSAFLRGLCVSREIVYRRQVLFRYLLLVTAFRTGLLLPTLLEPLHPLYAAGMIFSALLLDWGVALALLQRSRRGQRREKISMDRSRENKHLLYALLVGVTASLLPYISMLFDPTYILELYLILRLALLMIAVIPAVILAERERKDE